jgi:hypothetical protein
MGEGPIIRARDLLATWDKLPAEMRNDTQISVLVIKAFLGMPWIDKHLADETQTPGLLTIRGTLIEQNLAQIRVVDLAESLFNLCRIRGFNDCIERMKRASNPEPSLAELHIGKMLYANEWPFCFVVPQGRRGENYDLRIRYNNQWVCGDVKCKIESAIPDSKTITNTLKNSRTQLPSDKPGAFFVKIPQQWMGHKGWEAATVKGAIDFFEQGSGRIVSVAFYAEPIHLLGDISGHIGTALQGHHFYEVVNPRRRFGQHVDWKFFHRWRPDTRSASWGSMPPKYIRLFEFPKGLIGHEQE